jgi:two-component system CheB/CheR fusion protein
VVGKKKSRRRNVSSEGPQSDAPESEAVLASVNEELSKRNEQLSQAIDDLSNIMASTEMALVTVSPELRLGRFTPAAQRLLKLKSSDVGRPLCELELAFAVDDLESRLREAMKAVQVPDQEVQDRQGHWHSLRVRPYRTADGRIDGAVLVFVDIDWQKRNEESLRESQQKFHLLVEGASGIAILMLDNEGRFVGWNSGARRLFQYEDEEIRGRHLSTLFLAAEKDAADEELEIAASKGFVVEDHAMRRRDGSSFPISGVMTILRDEQGQARGYSKVVTDVSEQHRAAEDRRLEGQRKDEFLYILAHELRNPLAPIRSSLRLLDDPELSPEDARFQRGVIKQQVERTLRLIDDLVDVARIAKGGIEIRPEPVELAKVIETAVEPVRPLIQAAAQSLDTRLPSEPVVLVADPTRLAQAVSNLLINASRYTPDRGHIRLSAETGEEHCLIRVVDDGIGIEPDQQSQVFELFAQGNQLPGRTPNGLGIGLPIARALVELHAGHVDVVSAGRGEGSEFTITLPLHRRSG